MSESDASEEKPQITEVELKRMIEEKCYKAFMEFDAEGIGSTIKSDQVKDVLEYIDI